MTMRLPHSTLFATAIVAGASFWIGGHLGLPHAAELAWKGSGVALLAVWAGLNISGLGKRAVDGWLLTGVLAFGAIGDVLIDATGLAAGATAFLIGHVLAVALYARRPRPREDGTGPAILILVGVPVLAYGLSGRIEVLVYALGLGTMAAAGWISRFPRGRVGAGALLFAASDLLIFARMGPLRGSIIPDLLVWPLYFGGQGLIAAGVVQALRAERG